MRTLASIALAAVAVLASPGCATTSTPTTDAAVLPDVPPQPTDAFVVSPDAARCDLSPVPSPLPALVGVYLVEGPDTMPPMPPNTGNPVGTWLFDHVSFYVSPEAGTMFDAAASSATGTAWLAFDGLEVRLEMDFMLHLAGTLAGDITRATETRIRGSYDLVGSEVVFTPSCVEAAMSSDMPTFDFAVEGDRGTLIIQSNGMLGMLTIVLEGTRS